MMSDDDMDVSSDVVDDDLGCVPNIKIVSHNNVVKNKHDKRIREMDHLDNI